ncbi:MAG: hypothetical protein AAB614_02130 [Patescibacteria group bacterium]
MNLTIKRKLYIHLTILSIILIGMLFVSWFALGIIKKNSEELIQFKKDLFQIQIKREKALEASKEYDNLKPFIDVVNSAMLSKKEELKFIVFIESIAKRNILNHEINITTSSDEDNIKESIINFQVKLSGSFQGILKFIKDIEDGLYYANISNIDLKRVSASTGSLGRSKLDYALNEGDVEVSLIIKVYSY